MLYNHFNAMSAELESQFDRSYQEQPSPAPRRVQSPDPADCAPYTAPRRRRGNRSRYPAGYNESLRRSVDADALAAMGQAELRLEAVIEDSKAVSYDGVIRRTYRDYQLNLVRFFVYRDVTEYLAQEFTRNSSYRAVFISFLVEHHPGGNGDNENRQQPAYQRRQSQPCPQGSGLPPPHRPKNAFQAWISFSASSILYMVRNLLDQDFEPYAALVMALELEEVFQSLYHIGRD